MPDLRYVPLEEFRRVLEVEDEFDRAALFATLARINTLYMIKKAGSGHVGSSFSSLDIVSWLYLNELGLDFNDHKFTLKNIYFSSKGHDVPGLYSVLTGLGLLPFDMIHELRRCGGLPGHPDVSTPFIATNTGSLGMGISKAKGFIMAGRLSGDIGRVFVMTGDGELQEGQIWESLLSASNMKMHELTVIVDNNRLQSDLSVRKTSDLGNIEEKFKGFGWHVLSCSGHDFRALSHMFREVRSVVDRPSVIVAETVKGCGVLFMEPDYSDDGSGLYRYHSGAPSQSEYEKGLDELKEKADLILERSGMRGLQFTEKGVKGSPGPVINDRQERLVDRYAKALVAAGASNEKLIVMDADLRKDCGLLPFVEKYPDRFIECGIAEQDMVSQAGAMALKGFLPVVHSFASFLPSRANDQIYNNATEKTRVIYTCTLAGLLPGGPGHSHQSVRDIALLSHIPGLIIIEPSCEAEAAYALDYAVNVNHESTYIRLCSIPVALPFKAAYDMSEVGVGAVVRDGDDAVIFAYGPIMLTEVYKAATTLKERYGIEIKVVNIPWLNRLDSAWFAEEVKDFPVIFSVDNHYIKGGVGEMIGCEISSNPLCAGKRFVAMGVKDIPLCGRNEEVLAGHLLDAASVAGLVKKTLDSIGDS